MRRTLRSLAGNSRTPARSPAACSASALISEATWLAFAAFSGLRTISYVPQIIRIARDPNGASAISYPTWLLWTGANTATAMYAATNLNDVWLAYVSTIYALCCMVVIVLTAFKRLAHRWTKDVPTDLASQDHESERVLSGHLRVA